LLFVKRSGEVALEGRQICVPNVYNFRSKALHSHDPIWTLTASPGSRVILLILFLAYSACVTSFSCIVGVVFKVSSPAMLLCANSRFELLRQPSEGKVLLRLHDIKSALQEAELAQLFNVSAPPRSLRLLLESGWGSFYTPLINQIPRPKVNYCLKC